MRRVHDKLKSEYGASMLLTLLFVLLCLMVGGSILLSATANAGKAKSNEQEQQAYLALSSALKVVADDMNNAEYYGNYELSVAAAEDEEDDTEEDDNPGGPGEDEDDDSGDTTSPAAYNCTYTQLPGTIDNSKCLEKFVREFDYIFAQYLIDMSTAPTETPSASPSGGPGDGTPQLNVDVIPLGSLIGFTPGTPYELKVTPALPELTGFEVKITARVSCVTENQYTITLEAVLSKVPSGYSTDAGDYHNYKLIAVLRSEGVLSVSDSITEEDAEQDVPRVGESSHITWKLDHINRG